MAESTDMTDNSAQLSIPEYLFSTIQSRTEATHFESPDEYAAFVLEEVVHYTDEVESSDTTVDEEELKTRLKSLGYLEE
jgi:hypothetical protein